MKVREYANRLIALQDTLREFIKEASDIEVDLPCLEYELLARRAQRLNRDLESFIQESEYALAPTEVSSVITRGGSGRLYLDNIELKGGHLIEVMLKDKETGEEHPYIGELEDSGGSVYLKGDRELMDIPLCGLRARYLY